ncbi:MAG: hypothetical protein IT232_11790 [Flavobacteriales bacterium]|nr:hypothetical protein [Flavobacteriales bacterium]
MISKIKTWIKLGDLFIDEDNIRSIKKVGKYTIIEKIQGEPIEVEISYHKVKKLVKTL